MSTTAYPTDFAYECTWLCRAVNFNEDELLTIRGESVFLSVGEVSFRRALIER